LTVKVKATTSAKAVTITLNNGVARKSYKLDLEAVNGFLRYF